jgi:hypothetical protein
VEEMLHVLVDGQQLFIVRAVFILARVHFRREDEGLPGVAVTAPMVEVDAPVTSAKWPISVGCDSSGKLAVHSQKGL